jgi:hypothetical protein
MDSATASVISRANRLQSNPGVALREVSGALVCCRPFFSHLSAISDPQVRKGSSLQAGDKILRTGQHRVDRPELFQCTLLTPAGHFCTAHALQPQLVLFLLCQPQNGTQSFVINNRLINAGQFIENLITQWPVLMPESNASVRVIINGNFSPAMRVFCSVGSMIYIFIILKSQCFR